MTGIMNSPQREHLLWFKLCERERERESEKSIVPHIFEQHWDVWSASWLKFLSSAAKNKEHVSPFIYHFHIITEAKKEKKNDNIHRSLVKHNNTGHINRKVTTSKQW